ncbi:MAG TPA: FtsX-like permease family protein, partial [Bryobacteraceae bacterium]|nr:FtsX-like permease family protein [Bryobacteraceae bacterium]
DAQRRPKVPALVISPGYFGTLEGRLLSGRDFTQADENSRTPVAIVNQKFANAHWPGENPIGKRLRLFDGNAAGPWLTVVGVVSNIIQNDMTRQRFELVVYLPYRQNAEAGMWIFARTRIPPGQIASAFRREIRMLDAALPVYGPFGLAEHLERYWDSRFYGVLFLIFAGIALLLASVGLYAVMAHAVSRRTQEIGIRMAVGATRHDILAMVLRQGMAPLGIGLAIGLAGAFALTPILKSTLVNVSPADPIAFGVAAAVLLLAAALGCLIPARGAMRVDPAVALRHE